MNLNCESCGATTEVDRTQKTATCPYCGSPHVFERPPAADRPAAAFTIPFAVTEDAARRAAKRWKRRRRFFAPRALSRARIREIRGIYLPAYLYSATADADYRARIGEDYQVTVGSGKNRRRETRTEWFTVSGRWSGHVSDVVVTASKGLPNEELAGVEPFELTGLRRHRPELVSGWMAEEPSLSRAQSLVLGRAEASGEIQDRVKAFLPGDRRRLEGCTVALSEEDAALTLLPLWILAIPLGDGRSPVRLVVNGQTGRVHGRAPVSWARVALAILGLGALAGLAYLGWLWLQRGPS